MADRTSAEVFSVIFELLAENPTEEHKAMARKLWPYTRDYDFSPYQTHCDEALVKLGLMRRRVDLEYPEEGEVTFYGSEGADHR